MIIRAKVRKSGSVENNPAPPDRKLGRLAFAEFSLLSIGNEQGLIESSRSSGRYQWLNVPSANYAAVALTSVILMFILPNGQGGKLLDWESASTIHWGVLLLFAGGIAIAKAFAVTGISGAIGESLSGVTRLSIIVLIAVVALTVTFLTEITSNTATTTLLMPILAAASLGAGFEPALLMLPAALSASCAFMLPVATAPNAIVFGTGKITVEQMVREGFALNLIGVAVITAVVYFWLG